MNFNGNRGNDARSGANNGTDGSANGSVGRSSESKNWLNLKTSNIQSSKYWIYGKT